MFSKAVRALVVTSTLLCHLIALVLFSRTAVVESHPVSGIFGDILIFLGASFTLSIACHVARRQWAVGVFLGLRVLVVTLITVPLGHTSGVGLVTLLDLVVQSTFVLKSPLDCMFPLVAALAVEAAPTLYGLGGGPGSLVPWHEGLAVAVASLMLMLFTAAMKRLQAKLTLAADQGARLLESNVRLADTNLSFQDAFTREKATTVQEERKRIAREIHDSVAYVLTNLIMMIEDATDRSRSGDERLLHHLRAIRDHAHEGLVEVRQAVRDLRDSTEVHVGIPDVFRLARSFEIASHVTVDIRVLSHGILALRLSDEVSNALFRLVQESMTNAVRHGRSSRIVVTMQRQADELYVSIGDNGAGTKDVVEGLGILGMKERLAAVNGRISFSESPQGFSLTAWLPIPRTAEDEEDTHTPG
jgi:signal transduction histidine kinase